MGNAGACCSSNQTPGDSPSPCCSGSGSKGSKASAGVKPLGHLDILSSNGTSAPGFDSKAQLNEGLEDEPEDEPTVDSNAAARGAPPPSDEQTLTYQDGTTYTGELSNDMRHGHGKWTSPTGSYEGQWQADKHHGEGHQTWSDGRTYDGQYEDGSFHGRGRMEWPADEGHKMLYEGQYVKDKKHGKGIFLWADGRTYNGPWHEGRRHGRGIFINTRGQTKIGFWNHDDFERWEEDDPPKPSLN